MLYWIKCGRSNECFSVIRTTIKDNIIQQRLVQDGSALETTKAGVSRETMRFSCGFDNRTLDKFCVYSETSRGFDVHCAAATT